MAWPYCVAAELSKALEVPPLGLEVGWRVARWWGERGTQEVSLVWAMPRQKACRADRAEHDGGQLTRKILGIKCVIMPSFVFLVV